MSLLLVDFVEMSRQLDPAIARFWAMQNEKYPDCCLVVTCNSIMEAVIVCGFARALSNHKGKSIVLYVSKSHASIAALYPERFLDVVPLDQHVLRAAGAMPDKGGSNIISADVTQHKGSNYLLEMHEWFYSSQGRAGLSLTDMFRVILDLPHDAEWEVPSIEIFEEARRINGSLVDEDYALLFPGTNTNYPLKAPFWNRLAEKLFERDITPIFCVSGARILDHSLVMPEAQVVQLSVMDALMLSAQAKIVVSVLNGLAQLASIVAVLLRSDSQFHCWVPDKKCTRYDLLSMDFESAFTYTPRLTMRGGAPDLFSLSTNATEWDFSWNDSSQVLQGKVEQLMCHFDAHKPTRRKLNVPGKYPGFRYHE